MEERLAQVSVSQSDMRKELEEYMARVRDSDLVDLPETFDAETTESVERTQRGRKALADMVAGGHAETEEDRARFMEGMDAIKALDEQLAEKDRMYSDIQQLRVDALVQEVHGGGGGGAAEEMFLTHLHSGGSGDEGGGGRNTRASGSGKLRGSMEGDDIISRNMELAATGNVSSLTADEEERVKHLLGDLLFFDGDGDGNSDGNSDGNGDGNEDGDGDEDGDGKNGKRPREPMPVPPELQIISEGEATPLAALGGGTTNGGDAGAGGAQRSAALQPPPTMPGGGAVEGRGFRIGGTELRRLVSIYDDLADLQNTSIGPPLVVPVRLPSWDPDGGVRRSGEGKRGHGGGAEEGGGRGVLEEVDRMEKDIMGEAEGKEGKDGNEGKGGSRRRAKGGRGEKEKGRGGSKHGRKERKESTGRSTTHQQKEPQQEEQQEPQQDFLDEQKNTRAQGRRTRAIEKALKTVAGASMGSLMPGPRPLPPWLGGDFTPEDAEDVGDFGEVGESYDTSLPPRQDSPDGAEVAPAPTDNGRSGSSNSRRSDRRGGSSSSNSSSSLRLGERLGDGLNRRSRGSLGRESSQAGSHRSGRAAPVSPAGSHRSDGASPRRAGRRRGRQENHHGTRVTGDTSDGDRDGDRDGGRVRDSHEREGGGVSRDRLEAVASRIAVDFSNANVPKAHPDEVRRLLADLELEVCGGGGGGGGGGGTSGASFEIIDEHVDGTTTAPSGVASSVASGVIDPCMSEEEARARIAVIENKWRGALAWAATVVPDVGDVHESSNMSMSSAGSAGGATLVAGEDTEDHMSSSPGPE